MKMTWVAIVLIAVLVLVYAVLAKRRKLPVDEGLCCECGAPRDRYYPPQLPYCRGCFMGACIDEGGKKS